MTVNAPEGSWAYEWALKRGYLKGEKDSETQVIFPATIQAGEDLTVSIIGASNTVEHSIYLINDHDKTSKNRSISKTSGKTTWEGYELETGTYHIIVYTVTDTFVTLEPVSKQINIIGTKPVIDELEFPESIPYQSNIPLTFDSIESMVANVTIRDHNNIEIGTFTEYYWDQQLYLYTFDLQQGGTLEIQYIVKKNGMWCQPLYTTIKVTQHGQPGIPEITFPEEIIAGQDLVLSYSYIPDITSIWFDLFSSDNVDQSIYSYNTTSNESGSIVIPGYILNAGQYNIHIQSYNENAEDEYSRHSNDEYTFNVIGTRTGTIPEVFSDCLTVYENDSIHFTVSCPNTDKVAIKYHYQRNSQNEWDEIKTYYLNDDGTLYAEEYARPDLISVSVCAEHNEGYSPWSSPLYWEIMQIEPLPSPNISIPGTILAGEDVTISWEHVPNADSYSFSVSEAYASESEVFYKRVSKDDSLEVTIPGYLLDQGYYRVHLYSETENRYYSTSESEVLFKVSGKKETAPNIHTKPNSVKINSQALFSIDTVDVEQLIIRSQINGYGANYQTINVVSNITNWSYTPIENYRNKTIEFKFAVKKANYWSAWKTITYMIEDLEQLLQPEIQINDTYQAGETIVLRFNAVENATKYEWRIVQSSSNKWINSGTKTINSTSSIFGYEIEPGMYQYSVTAYGDGYRSNTSVKTFVITGSKQSMTEVTVDKTQVSSGETFTFTIDTTGISSLRYKVNDYSSNSIRVLSDITRFTTSNSSGGEQSYQFAGFLNGRWTAWSEPLIVTTQAESLPSLSSPILIIEDSFQLGQDIVGSFEPVEGANYYYVYLFDEFDNTIQSKYKSSAGSFSFNGYDLSAGKYTIEIRASGNQSSSYTDKAVMVIGSELTPAPEIISLVSESPAGSNVSFTINTTNATKLAVQYYRDGYTNNLESTSTTTSGDSTVWYQYRSIAGEVWYYRFSVYQNDTWTQWTSWQEVHITNPE